VNLIVAFMHELLTCAMCFRRQRKQLKREKIAAVEIQRMARGKARRKKFRDDLERMQRRLKQEKDRFRRLRRIRAQEKELALLRQLPVQSYLDYERIRKDSCAKYGI
jgi:hypothetical protein